MVINHNLAAMNTQLNLGKITTRLAKHTEKLSSGYRINRSADDAAGLSISEKMRAQIRGLNQASRNAQDGISLIQTAEGALGEVHSLLDRGKELSVQAANDTNTDIDRTAIQKEIDQINAEIDRIASTTQFNTMNLFSTGGAPMAAPIAASATESIAVENTTASGNKVAPMISYNINYADIINKAQADGATFDEASLQAFANELKDTYLPTLLGGITDTYQSLSTPSVNNMKLGLNFVYQNDGALAYVTSNGIGYGLTVNMKHLEQQPDGSMASKNSTDIAGTIAHELVHAVMFDTVTNGMTGNDKFPLWFIEGMAQTASGGANYCLDLYRSKTDDDIKDWLSGLNVDRGNEYAQGYIATMYLGQAASGSTSLDPDKIAQGLDKIINDIADGYSLSEAISRQTNNKYTSIKDFENKFKTDALDFAKEFKATVSYAMGHKGSLVAPGGLTANHDNLLTITSTSDYFQLDTATEYYLNTNIPNPYTGGKATTTDGSRRDGSTNSAPKPSWSGGNSGGSGSGGGGTAGGGGNATVADNLRLQVGATAGADQTIVLNSFELSSTALGIDGADMSSHDTAAASISLYDTAIETVSSIRSYYGAVQNRLEHSIKNLDNTAENVQASESVIRDTDMAKTMVEFSKDNILQQAAQAMLTQANQSTQGVMNLLP